MHLLAGSPWIAGEEDAVAVAVDDMVPAGKAVAVGGERVSRSRHASQPPVDHSNKLEAYPRK